MPREAALAAIAASIILLRECRTKKPKCWWTRRLFAGEYTFGLHLLDTLKLEDGSGFRNFTRITQTDFECFLQMTGGEFQESKTLRQSVASSVRLAATLRFLASGDSFTSLTYTFKDFEAVEIPSKLGLQSVELLVLLLDSKVKK
jgi:hypothetical protein